MQNLKFIQACFQGIRFKVSQASLGEWAEWAAAAVQRDRAGRRRRRLGRAAAGAAAEAAASPLRLAWQRSASRPGMPQESIALAGTSSRLTRLTCRGVGWGGGVGLG